MLLYSSTGDGYNLAKGAFDSSSIAKPGTASLLLAEYMPKEFEESYNQLVSAFRTKIGVREQSAMSKLWSTYLKPGLKKAGAIMWEIGKPLAMEAIAAVAGVHPGVAALVGATEAVMSAYLTGRAGPIEESKSVSFKKGEWLFIEKAENHRRRMKTLMTGEKLHTVEHSTKDEGQNPPANVVNFGFFVSPSKDVNKANVFNIDTGKEEEVVVQQLRMAPTDIQKEADLDEKLSVVRELFFYKKQGDEFENEHPNEPIIPGRFVICKGRVYVLIQRNGGKALIQNDLGKTQVVDVKLLTRGVGKSTLGFNDDMFMSSNSGAFYAGQWIMAPARLWVSEQWSTDLELAVIYNVYKDSKLEVAFCIDGVIDYVEQTDCAVLGPNMQIDYSKKQEFKLFKDAAVHGNPDNTKRFELGSKFALICTLDRTESLRVLGHKGPVRREIRDYLTEVDPALEKTQVGNNAKEIVDAKEELFQKTGVKLDHNLLLEDETEPYYATVDEGGGDGLALGLIAVVALFFIGFGGAAAAIPVI